MEKESSIELQNIYFIPSGENVFYITGDTPKEGVIDEVRITHSSNGLSIKYKLKGIRRLLGDDNVFTSVEGAMKKLFPHKFKNID